MTDEQHIDLVTAYLDGSISPSAEEQLQRLIEAGEIDISDIDAMKKRYQKLGEWPVPEPDNRMRTAFYAMLEAEKSGQLTADRSTIFDRFKARFTPRTMQRWAVAAVLFLMGIVAGNLWTPFQNYQQQMNRLSSEVTKMREVMMLSLLDAQSPTERLQAVNISSDISSADHRIISALLKTLNNDPNVNVRLASIEALLQHAQNPTVRQGLVRSIARQQSPQVQVALADAMLALQETRSVDELQQLLRQNELDTIVRKKLKTTIAALQS